MASAYGQVPGYDVIEFRPHELDFFAGQPRKNTPMCDFCTSPDPAWRYPARDIELGTLVGFADESPVFSEQRVSAGDWAACEECGDLIEARDWPGLARRSLRVQ